MASAARGGALSSASVAPLAASLRAAQPRRAAQPPRVSCGAARLASRRGRALGEGLSAAPRRRRAPCAGRGAPAAAPRAAAPRVELATRRDFADVADAFVDAFFLDGRTDALDGSGRARLGRAALNDLEGRYSSSRGGERALFLVRDDGDGEVLACAGVEPQYFVGNAILRGPARTNPPSGAVQRPVVSNVAVAPRARRRGLGGALMRACEAQAASWGYDECLLLVERGNARARKLYRKLGYKDLRGGEDVDAPSLKVQNGTLNDVRVTNIAMRKSLAPFPAGALQNADPVAAAAWVGAAAAAAAAASEPQRAAEALAAALAAAWLELPPGLLDGLVQ